MTDKELAAYEVQIAEAWSIDAEANALITDMMIGHASLSRVRTFLARDVSNPYAIASLDAVATQATLSGYSV